MRYRDEIAAEIKKHNKLYWEENAPIIEDSEFDLLVAKLRTLDPNHPIFSEIEEQKSAEVVGKYKHKDPMLSLEKYYSKAEVLKWMKSVSRNPYESFRFELKLDGCSGKREDGHLATRGDGFLGEDHTDKIPYIDFLGCDDSENMYVGEILITDKFFMENLKGDLTEKNYKNSRNAAAGILGNKDPEKIKGKGLTFINYDYEKITKLCTVAELGVNWDLWQTDFLALGLPYDGLVIKLADKDYYNQLGNKTKSPRGAIAYKFANKSAITKVKDITWQVSRNGRLTPVAELEPIELAGVTISRATCHNYNFVVEKGIVSGVSVVIERAGDVIPKIINTINSNNVGIGIGPPACPSCGGIVRKSEQDVDIFCMNEDCPDRTIENICFIADIIGIEELGRPTAEKIHNYFDSPYGSIKDVFTFGKIHLDDLLKLEGYGEKSAKTLYDNIQSSLHSITEVQFLTSFGISGIGRRMSKKILDDVGGLEKLFDVTTACVNTKTFDLLTKIDDVGKITAKKLILAIRRDRISNVYHVYCNEIMKPIQEQPKAAADKGKICFTGKGDLGRKEYAAIAESKGFESVSSAGKDLVVLVTHDPDSNSGKMKTVRGLNKKYKLDIKIISYVDFMAIA